MIVIVPAPELGASRKRTPSPSVLATRAGLLTARPSSARTAETGPKRVVREKRVIKKRVKARRRVRFELERLLLKAKAPTEYLLAACLKPLLFVWFKRSLLESARLGAGKPV